MGAPPRDAGRLAAAAETRRDVARQAYRDLLARPTPGDIRRDAWFGLAETALAAGDWRETQQAAEGFLREVAADDPRAVRANLVLVRALEAQGLPQGPAPGEVRAAPAAQQSSSGSLPRSQWLVSVQRHVWL
jgi:hypothetical protein